MGKTIRILLDIFCFIFIAISIGVAILFISGIHPMIIISGSMEPMIPTGSICFVDTNYSFEDVKETDVIVYRAPQQKVMHRVIEVTEEGLRVKGDANEQEDKVTITKGMYVGKYVFSITQLGYITMRLQTPISKAIFLTFIIALFVIDYLMHYAAKRK